LLAEQKKIIDAKNEDMTASVRYAERIQKALFSPITSLNKIFPESFIILKPRDIVSGDFYWFSEIGNKIVVAAADCTGHGIPGAFMSVLGISFFDEIVNKSHITESDQIINKLRNNIVKSFHVTDEAGQAKDGMDLTLVVIDKQKMTLQFSGAYNPLLIMRDGEAIVHKADRMPVGFHDKYHTPFTKHEFELKKGDLLYMFSDGFLDQFGGLHGKKFLFKRLQEVLQKICYKSMEDQRDILESAFKQWKGKYDQVDDVLLMGIRI
jgi:serine phosphatase RsbU (regulator of sigma subunit)